MDHVATLFLAAVGLGCIGIGYRLFCGLPTLTRLGARASRSSVFLMNIVPGVIFAILGAALLTTQAQVMFRKPATSRIQTAPSRDTPSYGVQPASRPSYKAKLLERVG